MLVTRSKIFGTFLLGLLPGCFSPSIEDARDAGMMTNSAPSVSAAVDKKRGKSGSADKDALAREVAAAASIFLGYVPNGGADAGAAALGASLAPADDGQIGEKAPLVADAIPSDRASASTNVENASSTATPSVDASAPTPGTTELASTEVSAPVDDDDAPEEQLETSQLPKPAPALVPSSTTDADAASESGASPTEILQRKAAAEKSAREAADAEKKAEAADAAELERIQAELFQPTAETPLLSGYHIFHGFDLGAHLTETDPEKSDPFDPFAKPAAPDGEKLSLVELFNLVLQKNTDVRIAKAIEEARRFEIDVAAAQLQPTVDLEFVAISESALHDTEGETAQRVGETSVRLQYRLYDFGARDYDISRAEAAAAQASAERRSAAEGAFEEIANSLMTYVEVDRTLKLVDDNIARLSELGQLVTAKLEAGAATAADVEQISSRVEAARTARSQLVTNQDSAANAFLRRAGISIDSVDTSSVLEILDAAEPFKIGDIDQNPDVLALQHRIDSLRRRMRSLQRGELPTADLELFGSHNATHGDDYSNTMTGAVTLTLKHNLWDGGASRARIAQSISQIQEAELRRADLINELVEEAQNTQRTTRAAQSLEASLAEQVISLKTVTVTYVDQFAAGQRTIFELLEADAALLQARVAELNQKFALIRNAITQQKLAGRLVPSILNSDGTIAAQAQN